MGLLYEMDLACTDELTHHERTAIEPALYAKILEICARVAHTCTPLGETSATGPRPPATQHIRAELLIPDDLVWRTDLSFDEVESVTNEIGEVVVVYRGGRTTIHDPADPVRVAVNPHKAKHWNSERVFMDETTLRSVAEAYGVF